MVDNKKKAGKKATKVEKPVTVVKKKRHTPFYTFVEQWLAENKAGTKLLSAWEADEAKLNKFLRVQTKKVQTKRLKDPNHPKRPLSAYMIYCNQNREKVKTDNPNIEIKDIMKELGKGWKALNEKQRQPYVKEAEKLKLAYNKQMESYVPPEGFQKKDKSKPKKAWTNYIFFCEEKRAEIKKENPDMKATEILKELGRIWNSMSDAEKAPYNKKAEKAKAEYQKQVKASVAKPKAEVKAESDEELDEE